MESRFTVPHGEKIKELRSRAGMTQEKLGLMSNVDRRTIQRAEKSTPLQIDSLASIASALNVPLPQITRPTETEDDFEDAQAKSVIVLRPVQSGMALINTVRGSFDGTIGCEAEPTPENIDTLTAIVATIEEAMPNPWRKPTEEPDFPLSARLRVAVDLGEHLKRLEGYSISVFVATYTARTQVPHYDMDEGAMYTTSRTPYELVTICKILLAPANRGDRISLKVNDLYVQPQPPAFESPEELQAHADRTDQGAPF